MQTLGEAVVRRHAEVSCCGAVAIRPKNWHKLEPHLFSRKNKLKANGRNRTRTQGDVAKDELAKGRGSYMLSTHRR